MKSSPHKKTVSATHRKPTQRILLCVSGLSPQIITETLYALSQQSNPPWLPDAIHIITTETGKEKILENLLSKNDGKLQQLCQDYRIPLAAFDARNIHVPQHEGRPLEDIHDEASSSLVADFITHQVRELCKDANTEIHASIAGGRKTMGYLLGHAMSLFGRPQDRLSHVLVEPGWEGKPDFYYPRPGQNIAVRLANIPFIRLSSLLPPHLLQDKIGYHDLVAHTNDSLSDARLEFNLSTKTVRYGAQSCRLPPLHFTILCLIAYRQTADQPFVRPTLGVDEQWQKNTLDTVHQIFGEDSKVSKAWVEQRLKPRFTTPEAIDLNLIKPFDQALSKLRKQINAAFINPSFGIENIDDKGKSCLALTMPTDKIQAPKWRLSER